MFLIWVPQMLVQGIFLLSYLMFDYTLPPTVHIGLMMLAFVLMLIIAAWLFVQRSRWKRLMRELEGWFCPACWYDLSSFRGQDGKPIRGICPECGGEFSVEDNQKLYNIKVQEHLGNKKT